MSYSRWSYSVWYTFWSTVPGTETRFKLPTQKLRNRQTFEVCDFPSCYITYGEIKEKGATQVLKEIEEFYNKDRDITIMGEKTVGKPKKPTKKQMTELYGYLELFIQDVDDHFSWGNFFKYEWYYPLRNKIRRYFKK